MNSKSYVFAALCSYSSLYKHVEGRGNEVLCEIQKRCKTRVSKEVVYYIQILVGRFLVKTVVQFLLTGPV